MQENSPNIKKSSLLNNISSILVERFTPLTNPNGAESLTTFF